MGWSSTGPVCPNHPYHDQRKGVCPSCLREKLSDLSSAPSLRHGTKAPLLFPPSSLSSLSSSPSSRSNRLSPGGHRRRRRHHHHRHGSEILGSVSFRIGVSGRTADALKKSHSLAFVSRNRPGGEAKNSKRGFWSKLLHWKGKKEILMDPGNVKGFEVNLDQGI